MKWKDTEEMNSQEDISKEEYFDEEQYSPWSAGKDPSKRSKLTRVPLIFILLALAMVTSVTALLMLLIGNRGETVNRQQWMALEGKVQQLEDRLEKYDAIDEKVTRIWEQAKSFEKFKDRFDRSEASTSLRMDHLTMSLEALQKEIEQAKSAKTKAPARPTAEEKTAEPAAGQMMYHTVTAGDTFYSISKRYNLELEQLLEMNRLQKDSILVPGQKLIVRRGASK